MPPLKEVIVGPPNGSEHAILRPQSYYLFYQSLPCAVVIYIRSSFPLLDGKLFERNKIELLQWLVDKQFFEIRNPTSS